MARLLAALLLMAGCASAGAGTADDDTTGDDDAPDAGVVIVADGAPPDATATPCDLVAQTGCTSDKPACDLGAGAEHVCREVTAPGTETNTCALDTECAAGYVCIGAAGKTSCMRYCGTDGDCGGAAVGSLCLITLTDANDMPIAGAKLCTQACNPVDSTGCPTMFGCHVYSESAGAMRDLTSCDPGGVGGQNATCTDNTSCQPGFDCFSVTSGGTTSNKCLKNCNATQNIGCAGIAGTTCMGSGAIIGSSEYGACL